MASNAAAAVTSSATQRIATAFGPPTLVGGITIFLMVSALLFLVGNIILLVNLTGSKDDWDSIKGQLRGSISMSFIGAAIFAVAMCLYVAQYDLGNLMIPMILNIAIGSTALAVGFTALSVAAITR
jgi:hypothetical protein